MADKRTTPEAHAGARRRKRAAPTIDLTATEVKPAAGGRRREQPAAYEPQPPPAAPEPPPAAATRQRPAMPGHRPSGNFSGPTLAAGVAGAAMVTLVLFALWLTGLVPIRYAGSTAMRARVTGAGNGDCTI